MGQPPCTYTPLHNHSHTVSDYVVKTSVAKTKPSSYIRLNAGSMGKRPMGKRPMGKRPMGKRVNDLWVNDLWVNDLWVNST